MQIDLRLHAQLLAGEGICHQLGDACVLYTTIYSILRIVPRREKKEGMLAKAASPRSLARRRRHRRSGHVRCGTAAASACLCARVCACACVCCPCVCVCICVSLRVLRPRHVFFPWSGRRSRHVKRHWACPYMLDGGRRRPVRQTPLKTKLAGRDWLRRDAGMGTRASMHARTVQRRSTQAYIYTYIYIYRL